MSVIMESRSEQGQLTQHSSAYDGEGSFREASERSYSGTPQWRPPRSRGAAARSQISDVAEVPSPKKG